MRPDDDLFPDSEGHTELKPITKEIIKKVVEFRADEANAEKAAAEVQDIDEDDFTRQPVDFGKKIEREMRRNAAEIGLIERLQELNDLANSSEKYSFAWFKALLELECIHSSNGNTGNREISISFARVERPEQTRL